MSNEVMYTIALLVVSIVLLIDKLISNKHIASLTQSLVDARSDKDFIEHARELATEVVPTDLAHRILDSLDAVTDLVKTFTPEDVDKTLDELDGLGKDLLGDHSQ